MPAPAPLRSSLHSLTPHWHCEPDWDALTPPWRALESATQAEAWASPTWLRSWWDTMAGDCQFRLLCVHAQRAPAAWPPPHGAHPDAPGDGASAAPAPAPEPAEAWAACLPLMADRHRGLRRLQGMGGDSQRRALLGDASLGTVLFDRLAQGLAARRDWDLLELNLLPAPLAESLARACALAGLRASLSAPRRQRYVPLQAAWPEIEAPGQSSALCRLPRRERALSALGELRFEVVTDPQQAEARFEDCLRVEASGWKGRQGSAILSSPLRLAYYRALLPQLARERRLRLLLLSCGPSLIAFYLTVRGPRTLNGIKLGYDESWRKFSPGSLMILYALRYAHQNGAAEFDFLGGDEAFKADWTPCFRELVGVRVLNTTSRGRLAHLYRISRRWPRSQYRANA